MKSTLLVLLIVVSFAPLSLARAQTYPTKPLRMIVPFPPGGAADAIGRVIAQKFGESVGQQVVVDNRAGASGNIGAEATARSAGDGYTVLLGALTSHAINYTLERATLKYDLQKDLAPVSIVGTVPYLLVVHPSVPARSLAELIAYGKAHPKHLTYASSGSGAPQRLAAEMLKLRTGIDMLHVPFKGSGPAIIALVGGEVFTAFESIPATLPHVSGGKLRALVVTTTQRLPMLLQVPTTAEAGLPNFEVSSTFGILVATRTAKPIIDRLNAELAQIVQLPEVKKKLLDQGTFATHTTPDEAKRRIHAEISMWAGVISKANIQNE
jgi:tripartite-type tricarboxylate transporter receptor subunit TctC